METPTDIREDAFPARSQHTTGTVAGVPTTATAVHFSDKILVTISQDGRLAQWIQVSLSAPHPSASEFALPSTTAALPAPHLDPRMLLGGDGGPRETLAQLFAAQIASRLALRDPGDRRTVVVGLGLRDMKGMAEQGEVGTGEREAFFDVLELAGKVL